MMLQTVTGSIPEGKPHLPSGPSCISEVQAHSLEACKSQTHKLLEKLHDLA